MNYQFLQQLLQKAEEFEQEHLNNTEHTIENFARWLQIDTLARRTPEEIHEALVLKSNETLAASISKFVAFLYRYAKGYTKKALESMPMLSLDDFIYLATLLENPGISKVELIALNIQEKASGMEVIKRLLHNELIYQEDDTSDKRSKQLFLTDLGKNLLFEAFVPMSQVAEQVCGNLSEGERVQLYFLLQKLERFHRDFFEENNRKFGRMGGGAGL